MCYPICLLAENLLRFNEQGQETLLDLHAPVACADHQGEIYAASRNLKRLRLPHGRRRSRPHGRLFVPLDVRAK